MNIKEVAYELYKIDWKHNHITPEREMDSLRSFATESVFYDKASSLISFGDAYTSYNEYLEDTGFSGEIYVCFEEFVDNEYEDEEYIKLLLQDPELINAYFRDLMGKENGCEKTKEE